jgi:DNA polymerase III delta prime subunit
VTDAYAPTLRSIRTQAQVVRMPPPPVSKFISRLKWICESEGVEITPKALADLAEASHLDLRTALNTLEFVAITRPVTAAVLQLTPVGLKNAALTPFDVWTALFTQTTKLETALWLLKNLDAFRSPDRAPRRGLRIRRGRGHASRVPVRCGARTGTVSYSASTDDAGRKRADRTRRARFVEAT